jgi:hypothetical protein
VGKRYLVHCVPTLPERLLALFPVTSCQQACTCQLLFRKEVIQPQLPLQLPCYDFVPITGTAFGSSLLAVSFPTSGITSSHDVTGGVYKARERIHRTMLTRGY